MKRSDSQSDEPMEGSTPALPAEPGTLKVVILQKLKSMVINQKLLSFLIIFFEYSKIPTAKNSFFGQDICKTQGYMSNHRIFVHKMRNITLVDLERTIYT